MLPPTMAVFPAAEIRNHQPPEHICLLEQRVEAKAQSSESSGEVSLKGPSRLSKNSACSQQWCWKPFSSPFGWFAAGEYYY